MRNLGEQKGTQGALRSRKSAPVVPSLSIQLSLGEEVEKRFGDEPLTLTRAQFGLASDRIKTFSKHEYEICSLLQICPGVVTWSSSTG